MNPLEMTGPSFLTLYLSLRPAPLPWRRRSGGCYAFLIVAPEFAAVDLDPYEVAYLAGGEKSAVHAAIVSLVRSGAVTVNAAGRTLLAAGTLPPGLHPLERACAPDIEDEEDWRQIGACGRVAKPLLEKTRNRLTTLGLLMDDGPAWRTRLLETLPILAVLLLGLAKVQVGLSRGKPLGFLIVLCVLTAIAVVHFVQKPPYRRSRWGDRVLDRLRQQNEAMRLTGSRSAADLEAHDLALALGLFGTGILAGGPLNDLCTALASAAEHQGGGNRSRRGVKRGGGSDGGGGGGDGGGGGGGDGGGGGVEAVAAEIDWRDGSPLPRLGSSRSSPKSSTPGVRSRPRSSIIKTRRNQDREFIMQENVHTKEHWKISQYS